MEDDTHTQAWLNIGLHAALILNKFKTSIEIENVHERDMRKEKHDDRDTGAERCDKDAGAKLTNVKR